MKKVYPYRLNKATKRNTVITAAILAVVIVLLSMLSNSGYIAIWFLSFIAIILLLYILSIPRRVEITDDTLEIHCVVELTTIDLENIRSVRKMAPGEMKYCFPVLGSYGFFGYYGYYFSFSEMTLLKIYASQWNNFIRIEDIYEDIYVVNCSNPDEFIFFLTRAMDEKNIPE